ncbi:helix-turn-helix transcriptional regulator [Actinoallomurus iriomotensis]|uniref:Helix-turn-helix transcriptional regulator n=1 Tax=Actinoallomurus iriomotensis TaxID=478107 RepID=A0A9W6RGH4_9ACTN|nr:AAA family ATPase [Actinoallomurus iriomotensis]GLY74160.1 helix-turn-helix transcriptional regulator [Actinoallomurus iriomotensis]
MAAAVPRDRSDHAPMVAPPAFVGRRRELAVLAETLASPPAVVLVEGEAGIGKSRLLREFRAASAVRLMPTAECPPLHDPYTLGPVVDAVHQATDGVAGLGLSDLAGALRPLFPEWAADLPPAPEPAEDARAARHRLFRALVELLDRLDVAVLVVEDVHWADDATLEFLLFVTSRRPQPVSLVVTYRPEDVPAGSLLLRLSSRLPPGTTRARLALDPLDVAETANLVSSMLGGERMSAEFAAFLHQHTDGVPLAVEESVRLMHDRADVTPYGGGWIRRHLADIDVPPTVRDSVVERSGRLGEDAQAMLRAAAVLAEPANEATLAAVGELTADHSAAGLAEALDCGLLRDDERGLVSFRHGLACRAVYEATPRPLRRAMHLRAGRALEGMTPQPVVRLAHHFREADDTGSWARYAERAADVATEAGDWVAASVLLHGLLTSAGLPPAAMAPLAAKIRPGSLTGRSRLRGVVAALRTALDSGALDAGEQAATRYRLGMLLASNYDYDDAQRELELAVPGLRPGSVALSHAMTLLGWPLGASRPGRAHRDWLRRAADAASLVPAAERPDLATKRAVGLLLLDDPDGWAVAATVPDEFATPAQRRSVAFRDMNMGDLAMRWGRYAEARARLDNAWALAEEHGYPRYGEVARANLLHLDWFTGRWDGLTARASAYEASGEAMPLNRLEVSLVTGLMLAANGRRSEAESALAEVMTQMGELGAVHAVVEPAAALARLHLAAGRVEDALRVTAQPIGVVALKEAWLWATDLAPARVDALLAAGRAEDAAELVAAFEAGVLGRNAPAPQAALALCEGILAAGQGAPERAATAFTRAAAAWEALPRPYDALLARERRARCLLAAGRRDAGLSSLAEVAAGLSDLGASADAERLRECLATYGPREHGAAEPEGRRTTVDDASGNGERRRRGRPGYGDRLSPRELEVVRLLIDGKTNPQIAEALVLSRQTVNSHVGSAMRKLRVSSRTALAVSAVELGLARDGRAPHDDE